MKKYMAFIVCLICALVNLPFVMQGFVFNIAAMAFCGALAVLILVMALKD